MSAEWLAFRKGGGGGAQIPDWVERIVEQLNATAFAPLDAWRQKICDGIASMREVGEFYGLMARVFGVSRSEKGVKFDQELFGSDGGKSGLRQILVDKGILASDSSDDPAKVAEAKTQVNLERLKTGIGSAVGLPSEQQAQFWEGFQAGYEGVFAGDASFVKGTTATQIYLILWQYWPEVEAKIKSVAQLHTLLVECLGPRLAGVDRKRIEGLCRMIGLRFRGRGRPRKEIPKRPS
jgi:hypothetical protein